MAFYATHLQLHCLDNPNLSPLAFDFKQYNGTFQTDRLGALLSQDFLIPCKCTDCATKRCPRRNLFISCCPFCNCQLSNKTCKIQYNNFQNLIPFVPLMMYYIPSYIMTYTK